MGYLYEKLGVEKLKRRQQDFIRFSWEFRVKQSKRRLFKNYPATIWLLGLLLLLKSCFWLFASPLLVAPVLGIKNLVTMIPFFVLCLFVWNGKKGAMEAALGLTLADLLFFLIFFRTSFFIPFDIYPIDTAGGFSPIFFILNLLIYFCSAMIGYGINFLILAVDLVALTRRKSAVAGQ